MVTSHKLSAFLFLPKENVFTLFLHSPPHILGENPLGAIYPNKPLNVFTSNFGGTFEFPPEEKNFKCGVSYTLPDPHWPPKYLLQGNLYCL